MEIFNGRLSPGKQPDLSNSMVAVMVWSARDNLLLFRGLSRLDFAEGTGPSLKLSPVLLLTVLSVLLAALTVLCISLGTGLRGVAWWSVDPH
jgi:hypothetical protein